MKKTLGIILTLAITAIIFSGCEYFEELKNIFQDGKESVNNIVEEGKSVIDKISETTEDIKEASEAIGKAKDALSEITK